LRFADANGGFFPKVAAHGRAGSFVAQLIVGRFADPADLRVWLLCPGSAAGQIARANPHAFKLRTPEEIEVMAAKEFDRFTAMASPSYAHCLPFKKGGKLSYVRNHEQVVFPLIADIGTDDPRRVSANHQVCQVLFSDGHVRAQTSVEMPGVDNNIFLNDRDEVAAGVRQSDSVLGPSEATPDGHSEDP